MAKISYYTVDDEILGERTAGARRNYCVDALGSVTSTVQGSTIENTYTYAPSGTQLQNTGAGPDPVFRWIGSAGYYATKRPVAEFYVRARAYSTGTIRWLTRDPIWPKQTAYSYVRGRLLSAIDPSGLKPKHVVATCLCSEGGGVLPDSDHLGNKYLKALLKPLRDCLMEKACKPYGPKCVKYGNLEASMCTQIEYAEAIACNIALDPCVGASSGKEANHRIAEYCSSKYGDCGNLSNWGTNPDTHEREPNYKFKDWWKVQQVGGDGCECECSIRVCCWIAEPLRLKNDLRMRTEVSHCLTKHAKLASIYGTI